MEYFNSILHQLGEIINLESQYIGRLGVISLSLITLMGALFLLELFFYLRKRPRGLSNIILIIGILGTFFSLYITLSDPHQTKPISNQVLDAALIGICGGLLAIILSVFESLYYSRVDEQRSVERSVKDLIRLMKDKSLNQPADLHKLISQPKSSEGSASTIGKQELQHISQQIYDLTHHLKQELSESRVQSDENIEKLISHLKKLSLEENAHQSTVLGPKIVAKTSLNSYAPSSNDASR